MIRIFEISEGELAITEHAYLVSELKTLIDKYDDPIPIMKYIYLLTAPDSPYYNLTQEEKEEAVQEEAGGDFSLDDPDIDLAIDKLKSLYETPTVRLYNSIRINMDRISVYLANQEVTDGRDGNFDQMTRYQKDVGKIIESFKKLEKAKDDEIGGGLRGSAEKGRY